MAGLERDRQAAQEAAALRGEVQAEKGSTLTRMVNEPVLETLRATPVVNYVVPGYTPSSATPYATGQGGATGDEVGMTQQGGPPPGATGPTAQDEIKRRLAALDAFYAGMRGAPQVSMNEDMRKGIAGEQAAMRGVIGVMEGQQAGQEAARAGLQTEGAKYLQGLQGLQAQQTQDFAARRQQMAADEAALAQAREQFDPSRTLREIGKSPVSTGALTFAAGLVGALKGAAGQMGPNEILQEVEIGRAHV